jgi:acetyl-CoA carboxylase, biotin carboxylase subunit
LNLPGGVGIRVDTAAYHDGVIPPYYDSLVAKLIAYGADRAEAIARMRRALDMFVVEGIYTSIPLHQQGSRAYSAGHRACAGPYHRR